MLLGFYFFEIFIKDRFLSITRRKRQLFFKEMSLVIRIVFLLYTITYGEKKNENKFEIITNKVNMFRNNHPTFNGYINFIYCSIFLILILSNFLIYIIPIARFFFLLYYYYLRPTIYVI